MDRDTFIKKIVFCWIKEDIRRMQKELEIIPDGCGNINFPLALCTLVDMEYLGGFLLGKDCGFNKNVEEYIRRCFKNQDNYSVDILRDVFRNGLAHEYFARGGVSREGKQSALFFDDKIGVVLDAETLVNDFLASLDSFKEELSENNYKSRMTEAEETIKEKLDKHQDLINNLPRKATPSNTSTNISTTSGFTSVIPPPPHWYKKQN